MMERRKSPLEQIESQKLAVLLGERGDADNHALRRSHLTEVQALIASVTKQAKVLQGQLTTAEEAIVALQGNVSTLQGDVITLDAALAAAQATLAALLADVAGLTTAISNVPAHEAALVALGAVAVPGVSAAAVGAPPTAAEHNAVVADLTALRAALADIVGAGL